MQKDIIKSSFMILLLIYLGGGTIWTRYTMSVPQFNVGTYFAFVIFLFVIVYYKISFRDRYFVVSLVVISIWSVLQSLKYHSLQIPYTFIYDLIYGYVILKVFKKDILVYLEHGIYWLAKIGLIMWVLSWVTYPLLNSLMYIVGNYWAIDKLESSIFVFGMFPIGIDDTALIFVRNPGFAWEAGRFSVMLNLGLLSCFYIRRSNRILDSRKLIYILAILTTQSTTGYLIMVTIFVAFLYIKNKVQFVKYSLVSIPILIGIYNLPFVGDKILTMFLENDDKVEVRLSNVNYYSNKDEEFVPQRIEGLALELLNIQHDPFLGYGKDIKKSYIGQTFYGKIVLYDGILKVFSCFGLFMGFIYYYYFVYNTSLFFSNRYRIKGRFWYFIFFIMINVSYYFIYEPLFLALGMLPYETKIEKS